MPEYTRAFFVILIITAIILPIARPAFADFVSDKDFIRRSFLWIVITLILFLLHNFWVYLIGSAIAIRIARSKEKNFVALYFMLLFVAPPVSGQIPGLGVVDHLFTIGLYRLLALIILLPAAIKLSTIEGRVRFGSTTPDKLLIAYAVLTVMLHLRDTTVTNTLRYGFYVYIDMLLPYYVLSRALQNMKAFNEAIAGFVTASVLLAGVAIFENLRSWLLYQAITFEIGGIFKHSAYLIRSGSLRAESSVGGPIALGFALMVALGFCIYLRRVSSKNIFFKNVMIAVIAGGLYATISRGPWLGMVVFIIVFYLLSGVFSNSIKLVLGFALAAILLTMLPGGEKIINVLPFIGHSNTGQASYNVIYRERLLTVGMDVASKHPLLGSVNFMQDPEMQVMRQGHGLIDIVNSYLGILLNYGWIGLSLFVGFFAKIIFDLFRSIRQAKATHQEAFLLGATLIAALISIMFTIFTTSGVLVIPVIYWAIAGLSAGYIQMIQRKQLEA